MKKLLVFLCILAICGMAASAFAGETRGVGYWKNHYGEYDLAYNYGDLAASKSYILNQKSALLLALSYKGKKTIEEHAKRQLAAMLLNIVDGLQDTILLNQGELELIQQLNPAAEYALGTATVGNALTDIQIAIAAYDETDLISEAIAEIAKDLADEINNRGAY